MKPPVTSLRSDSYPSQTSEMDTVHSNGMFCLSGMRMSEHIADDRALLTRR